MTAAIAFPDPSMEYLAATECAPRRIRSPWIGEIEWGVESEILFPCGLPGFEAERFLIPVEVPVQRPLVYLQSTVNPGVCFLCLPVHVIDPRFELQLSEDERSLLGLSADRPAEIGVDVLCLAFLMPCGATVKTNLAAPIVINLNNSRGVQCVGPRAAEWRLEESGRWETGCS